MDELTVGVRAAAQTSTHSGIRNLSANCISLIRCLSADSIVALCQRTTLIGYSSRLFLCLQFLDVCWKDMMLLLGYSEGTKFYAC